MYKDMTPTYFVTSTIFHLNSTNTPIKIVFSSTLRDNHLIYSDSRMIQQVECKSQSLNKICKGENMLEQRINIDLRIM